MKVGDIVHGYELLQKIDRGGSDREFFRCTKDNTLFVMVFDSEIKRYICLQQHLAAKRIAVPEVFWYDLKERIMVQEDLGSHSLYETKWQNHDLHKVYKQVIDELIRLQIDGRPGVPIEYRYDADHIRWEQEYFRDHFLRQFCGIPTEHLKDTEVDLQNLGCRLLQAAQPIDDHLMHRDFQSQNLFYKENRIRIIDFQSARIGPLTYDLAALLRDPYVNIKGETEDELFEYYHTNIQKRGITIDRADLREVYQLSALQRGMQALGAFANLSLNKNKKGFLQFIPRGIHLLKQGLKETCYKALHATISSINI
ncbi:MAG: phosphotransferase [candidate division WOR-3 bacterium]|nr:MAG: phosphotransferase [candidate division WOR-3 bacterium]